MMQELGEQEQLNYRKIAEAIEYIRQNFTKQPSLEQVAETVHLSPFHFQRLFTEWAGVSPKKFLQYTSLEYAREMLRNKQASLFDTAMETGLSGTGRLHDLFVKIEAMSPAEYKNGGGNLEISYSFSTSPFGDLIVASTAKGICYMAFMQHAAEGLAGLQKQFPAAKLVERHDVMHSRALDIFQADWNRLDTVKLHLKGTSFQVKVWETLLKIPMGRLESYGHIAGVIGNPSASRAVGTAIGSNPVAFLIPCHRVIQGSGALGGYMWGLVRKTAMIGWEAAHIQGSGK